MEWEYVDVRSCAVVVAAAATVAGIRLIYIHTWVCVHETWGERGLGGVVFFMRWREGGEHVCTFLWGNLFSIFVFFFFFLIILINLINLINFLFLCGKIG